MRAHTHTQTHAGARAHIHKNTPTLVHTLSHARAHTCTNTQTCVHIIQHTRSRASTHAGTREHENTHAHKDRISKQRKTRKKKGYKNKIDKQNKQKHKTILLNRSLMKVENVLSVLSVWTFNTTLTTYWLKFRSIPQSQRWTRTAQCLFWAFGNVQSVCEPRHGR